jgi:hypothetical protein
MSCRSARVGAALAAALGAVFLGPAAPATATYPLDPAPSGFPRCTTELSVVVCMIEVPVKTPIAVPDRGTELVHLALAAGVGAAVAARATITWSRRRRPHVLDAGGDRLIDLTDVVQAER